MSDATEWRLQAQEGEERTDVSFEFGYPVGEGAHPFAPDRIEDYITERSRGAVSGTHLGATWWSTVVLRGVNGPRTPLSMGLGGPRRSSWLTLRQREFRWRRPSRGEPLPTITLLYPCRSSKPRDVVIVVAKRPREGV
jgi:hypothetical protein